MGSLWSRAPRQLLRAIFLCNRCSRHQQTMDSAEFWLSPGVKWCRLDRGNPFYFYAVPWIALGMLLLRIFVERCIMNSLATVQNSGMLKYGLLVMDSYGNGSPYSSILYFICSILSPAHSSILERLGLSLSIPDLCCTAPHPNTQLEKVFKKCRAPCKDIVRAVKDLMTFDVF